MCGCSNFISLSRTARPLAGVTTGSPSGQVGSRSYSFTMWASQSLVMPVGVRSVHEKLHESLVVMVKPQIVLCHLLQ